MFCVWCSLALVLARPFGSGDSVTPGLSMQRVSAASENLDRSAIQTAKSFEWPGRLNDGTEFSTTRSGRSSASMAFSYLTNKIGVLDLDCLYGVLDIVVDVLSIAGLALALRAPGGRKRMLVIASTFLPVVLCTCPGCFGNAPSCTYDTNGKCPTIDIPVANAAAVAGVATAVAAGLTLTNVISARFLRIFSRAHLQAVMQLVRRPAPGSIFEIKPDTRLTAILAAVSNGLITLDQATVTYAGFIDDESDDKKRAELVERYKLLTATKDIKTFSTASATATDMGVFSWLWGKITNFVAERGMQTVVMQLESASSTAAANVLSTSVKRFSDPTDFFEALNLFIMFCTALGLATAVAVTEFLLLWRPKR